MNSLFFYEFDPISLLQCHAPRGAVALLTLRFCKSQHILQQTQRTDRHKNVTFSSRTLFVSTCPSL